MRFLVLLLLIVLLPLRGELGFAVAAAGSHHGQGMTHATHADVASAPHAHAEKHHADEAPTAAHGAPAQAADAACDACSACQTCHAVGLVISSVDMASRPVPHAQPTSLSQHFASAPALRDQKPPIS